MDEKILIKKLQRKDERALEKIIDMYSTYITYIVWGLLHKKGTREDVEGGGSRYFYFAMDDSRTC